MENEEPISEQEKYLREDFSDLKEYAQKVLGTKGITPPTSIEEMSDWNIRNWGNYYASDFYNH